MKKIVGILAAAAMVASVFAADLTGGVRLTADLFNYNGTTESAKALMIKNENQWWHAPLTLTISDDRAGGTFKFCDADSDKFTTGKWAIWFKPMDMLKVNLGTIDKSMNTESIEYTGRVLNYDSFGASLDITVDAFSLNLALVPGRGSYWFQDGNTQKAAKVDAEAKKAIEALELMNKVGMLSDDDLKAQKKAIEDGKAAAVAADDSDVDAAIGEFNAYAQYAADFGTISAMFDAQSSFKNITLAAGYKNTFDPLTIFADVAFNIVKDGAKSLKVDFDAAYAQDALAAQVWVLWSASNLESIKKETMSLGTKAKVAYTLDAGTVWFKFVDSNLMAEDFSAKFVPGFTSKVSIMDYEIAVELDVAKKVNVAVPVWFKVNF